MKIGKYLPRSVRDAYNNWKAVRPLVARTCPICGFSGFFKCAGRPIRTDAQCPRCGSLERHRLFWLWYAEHSAELRIPALHFAAEPVLERQFRARYQGVADGYCTTDLFARADLKLDIENIELPDGTFSTIVCNHVLEHVDDQKALAEMRRILRDDGVAIISVPIAEGWASTYENPRVTDPAERELHFGQHDHVRYYGRDFRDRLLKAGFVYEEITSTPQQVIEYALLRGDKFFVCRKARNAV